MQQAIEYLGVSSTFLYYLLQGRRQPDLLTAHRLAAKLGCEIEDFTTPWVPQTDDASGGNPDA